MVKKIPAQGVVPCFMWENGQPITYSQFTTKLRNCLNKAGVNGALYSSHSFRARGASWAKISGVLKEFIQLLGLWKSDCYLKYLEFPRESHKAASCLMRRKILKLGY